MKPSISRRNMSKILLASPFALVTGLSKSQQAPFNHHQVQMLDHLLELQLVRLLAHQRPQP